MRDTLHWLPVRQRILYSVSTIAWRCILGIASAYRSELFALPLSCPGRQSLRSASRDDYLIPRSTQPLNRIRPSRRLVPLSGMAVLSIFPARFIDY